MALINCSECGKKISDKANACPNCGCPISNNSKEIKIFFEQHPNQVTRLKCKVTTIADGKEITLGECRQNDIVSFVCDTDMEIYANITGQFSKIKQTVKPGENYKIKFGIFGKAYFQKVDSII